MAQKLTVVVTGSTGKQGGAVARGLLERGHQVRAVTRDPDSSPARSLANAGATIVAASLEDTVAITKALEGATSLFAMTTPFGGGTAVETRQGVAAADAAKAAGVHLVFTSVNSANRQTGVPHFDSKYEVEKHIAQIGVGATILAPAFFMENLYFGKEQLAKGVYAVALPPTRKLAQIAVADIGAVAVRVLEDAARFAGRRFDLAGDDLTGNEVVAILSRVTGRPFSYFQVPLDIIRQRMGDDAIKMYEWFDRVGYAVDRAALEREFPDVAFHDFESWAKDQDWNALLSVGG
ncbi:MAG TPA: NmrA/HSCARG family protein [Polyangiaceae bacterium]|nr:NmrA/HSCARG family protein [Polyangiaceae bacterium]